MSVLVTGFGAFPGVADNPTAAIARAVDGQRIGDVPVVGRVLPVSFVRGPDAAIELAREVGAQLVVGLGVAVRRSSVCVERRGVRVDNANVPDVDGAHACMLSGPTEVAASLDVVRLADALGAQISDDAGTYVCNAWLYRVSQALDVPVGFVHVPPHGIGSSELLVGIAALL